MSNDFLTVEDVNSVIYANQKFWWHEIDTWEITEDKNFSNVKYDFCTISRTNSMGGGYDYTIVVDNAFWTKGFYYRKKNGERVREHGEGISGNTIYISSDETSLRIFLYMGVMEVHNDWSFMVFHLTTDTPSVYNLNLEELSQSQTIYYQIENGGGIYSFSKVLHGGFNEITMGTEILTYSLGYVYVNLIKTDFVFNCTQNLIVGKQNKVYLGANNKYKPNGALVGSYTPKITVDYNGETLPVQYDGTDYYFNLDLTDKTEVGKVRFTVNVEANEVLNSTTTEVALNSQYQTVSTFDAFLTAIANNDVIRLGANLTATSTIPVNRSVKIIGNDKTLNLDGYQFQLQEDVEFKAENLQLNNGDTTIIQAPNTKVELNNVTFTNCTSSDYNNLGSCIFCDSEAENIQITDDFTTTLTDCTFVNNHNAILHGGQLQINNCKFHNTDTTYVDIYNPAFIYQTDGDCTILNSVFDIDYGTDYSLCTGEQSIGFSQCIFMCGTTATINAITYDELKGNNLNGFFDNPQNNRAHIYAKYYYPQIETCVFSSPTSGNEDKALCYGLGGDDMIHKINCQVTRADSGNENTTRRISW